MMRIFRHALRLTQIFTTLLRHGALGAVASFGGVLIRPSPAQSRRARERGLRLARALQDLGPSFIKLGQAMSVRPDLVGREMAEALSGLRDRLPPFGVARARATIEAELGAPLDELFCEFDEHPVAAASIAQVHFAAIAADEEGAAPRRVAVKVLRPGIEEAFARDLDLFMALARLLEWLRPSIRRLRPVDVVKTIRDAVTIEMDLRLEAAAASELAENFRDDPDYRVPAVDWARTAQRVLTIERVEGYNIGDHAAIDAAGLNRDELAEKLIRVFLKQALRDGFFHADLHQGNLFVDADGVLVPVDFGIMGRLDLDTRRYMALMLLGFIEGDYRKVADVHFEAGYVPRDQSRELFAQACRAIGEPILGKPVKEISFGRLLAQLFRTTETFNMQTQPQLLLLQKTMVTAEGVARDLSEDINFWEASRPVIEDWLVELSSPRAQAELALRKGRRLLHDIPALAEKVDRIADLWLREHENPSDAPDWEGIWRGAALTGGVVIAVLLLLDLLL